MLAAIFGLELGRDRLHLYFSIKNEVGKNEVGIENQELFSCQRTQGPFILAIYYRLILIYLDRFVSRQKSGIIWKAPKFLYVES